MSIAMKKSKIVLLCVLAVVVVAITVACVWIEMANNPKFYSYEDHYKNVSEVAEEKVGKGNYNIETLYDADGDVFGFLVEYYATFDTYDVVMIHNPSFLQKVAGVSMYCGADGSFMRYKIRNDETLVLEENGIRWERTGQQGLKIERNGEIFAYLDHDDYPNRLWEVNENGNGVMWTESPFRLADVNNEKKYFLEIEINGNIEYIPAVKIGDKFLNLISLEEFDYNNDCEEGEQAVMEIEFILHKTNGNYQA